MENFRTERLVVRSRVKKYIHLMKVCVERGSRVTINSGERGCKVDKREFSWARVGKQKGKLAP